jgi:SAM-dependent methyltransferase
MSGLVSNHYGRGYFGRPSAIEEFGGYANQSKFIEDISNKSSIVLDFSCGGGFLLRSLNCDKKVGVEVNAPANETGKIKGVEVSRSATEVPDDCANVIISSNALEHTLYPLEELKSLFNNLKVGGKIIFYSPVRFY